MDKLNHTSHYWIRHKEGHLFVEFVKRKKMNASKTLEMYDFELN